MILWSLTLQAGVSLPSQDVCPFQGIEQPWGVMIRTVQWGNQLALGHISYINFNPNMKNSSSDGCDFCYLLTR